MGALARLIRNQFMDHMWSTLFTYCSFSQWRAISASASVLHKSATPATYSKNKDPERNLCSNTDRTYPRLDLQNSTSLKDFTCARRDAFVSSQAQLQQLTAHQTGKLFLDRKVVFWWFFCKLDSGHLGASSLIDLLATRVPRMVVCVVRRCACSYF